jgi:repressor LexA
MCALFSCITLWPYYTPPVLTKAQSRILDFISKTHREVGVPPTLREIQERFGFASSTAAASHVKALVRKKALLRTAGNSRCYVPVPKAGAADEVLIVPLLGMIPAGLAVPVEEATDEYITISRRALGVSLTAQIFALRVKGDSMIGARILEDDIVFLDQNKEPTSKSIVAALIDGEVTLKTYRLRGGKPYLQAENPNYREMYPAHGLLIQGVKIGLFRRD